MRFLILLALFMTSSAQAEDYTHPSTGITLPSSLGELHIGNSKTYPTEGQEGVAVPYHGDNIEITVFFRKIDPPQTTAESLLSENLNLVVQMGSDGVYSNVQIYESSGEGERAGWKKGAFTARMDGAPIMSFIYVRLVGEYAVKLRVSASGPNPPDIRPVVSKLQDAIDAPVKSP
jgi:hypothetical protein